MIRTKGEAGTGDVVHAVKHLREVWRDIRNLTRNLLAQGYVPVIGSDGHTLYLVQSARSVRGGVAFVF